uniref:Uncharacterized protein n=1 Tax=Haptolina brevifila TaxID=156173 RepID=A0A7S2JB68_9EUKA
MLCQPACQWNSSLVLVLDSLFSLHGAFEIPTRSVGGLASVDFASHVDDDDGAPAGARVYVTDSVANEVREYGLDFTAMPHAYRGYSWRLCHSFGRTGEAPGEFRGLGAICQVRPGLAGGSALCLTETVGRRVQIVSLEGIALQLIQLPGSGPLLACCTDMHGRIWLLDDGNESAAQAHALTPRVFTF